MVEVRVGGHHLPHQLASQRTIFTRAIFKGDFRWAPAKKSRHRPVSSERVHQLDEEGNFAANRRGQPLCV
eukprot:1556733-Amphidinium_carterae.1